MGTLQAESEGKRELEDSGCVEDGSPPASENGYTGSAELLSLSDDVLLCILQYCSPHDLKALGFTCSRLGALVCDRSLWYTVDARAKPCGPERVRWFMSHGMHEGTHTLMIEGYAREADGCLGHVDMTRQEEEAERARRSRRRCPGLQYDVPTLLGDAEEAEGDPPAEPPYPLFRQHARLHINAQQLPRYSRCSRWPASPPPSPPASAPAGCPGPRYSLRGPELMALRDLCPRLTTLALDYCCLDCGTKPTSLSHFPPTLKKLSLRGVRCFNLPMDKSFLFKIHDYLPNLEDLDLSECAWMEPASLLPLSKTPLLRRLVMQRCERLSEFVAYASLASRYGFKSLEVLDLRGSPVADSEVAGLGWVHGLRELHLSPPVGVPARASHRHFRGDPPGPPELQPWEEEEPGYFRSKALVFEEELTRPTSRIRSPVDDAPTSPEAHRSCPKRKPDSDGADNPEPGPSKRQKSDTDAPPNHDHHDDSFYDSVHDENHDYSMLDLNAREKSRDNVMHEDNTDTTEKNRDVHKEIDNNKTENSRDRTNNDSDTSDKTRDDHKETDGDTEKCRDDMREKTSGNEGSNDKSISDNDMMSSEGAPGSSKAQRREQNRRMPSRSNGGDAASTSKANVEPRGSRDSSDDDSGSDQDRDWRLRAQDPVIIQCQVRPDNAAQDAPEAEPRHVLYVNVGQQLHAVYRLLPNQPLFRSISHRVYRPNYHTFPPTPHIASTFLVTDAAVRRFGRADGEDVNVVHIGPHGPVPAGARELGARPDRSSLEVLSMTGYRYITDRSLTHLATAAPSLRMLDFSNTGVTEAGVENFKSIRPDCEVVFSEFKEEE